jgi:hypothetical protein
MTWQSERDRILAGLTLEEARAIDWPALEAAYQLATAGGMRPAPDGWEYFAWLGGRLPTREVQQLETLTVRAGGPWLALGALGLLVLISGKAGAAGMASRRSRRRR